MARRKLMPVNPGAKVRTARSLSKQSGPKSTMTGAGARGTGRAKLNPTNGAKSLRVKSGQSGPKSPMKGVRGPTSTR